MKKRVLYLHGLESSNTGTKVDFLHEVADCYAPEINYEDDDIEKQLIKMVNAFKPDVIIGSSMGGYAAMLLGNRFNIKTIVFNPAIHSRSFDPDFSKLSNDDPAFGFTPVVVLGMEDDVINPLITKDILENSFIECEIEEIEGMGHRIPFLHFEHIYNKHVK